MTDLKTILFASGPKGIILTVPEAVQLLPVKESVDPATPLIRQQQLIHTALSTSTPPLSELAKDHRHAAILVGDLSLPAPYDAALPPVIAVLQEAGIRPSRISVIVCPGHCGPVLGRAAIHRYGEEIVGDHDLHALISGGLGEALYEKADLRIAVLPALPGVTPATLGEKISFHYALELQMGRKASIDIVSASAGKTLSSAATPPVVSSEFDVFLTSGGGAPWESTLEEALLSFWRGVPTRTGGAGEASSAVLAFTGDEGLGSARFTNELWSLLEQAEELLARGGSFKNAIPRPGGFDPALTVAYALSSFDNVIFYSRLMAEHAEGEDLTDRLAELPHLSHRMGLIGAESALWQGLESAHGPSFRLLASPLGWR